MFFLPSIFNHRYFSPLCDIYNYSCNKTGRAFPFFFVLTNWPLTLHSFTSSSIYLTISDLFASSKNFRSLYLSSKNAKVNKKSQFKHSSHLVIMSSLNIFFNSYIQKGLSSSSLRASISSSLLRSFYQPRSLQSSMTPDR